MGGTYFLLKIETFGYVLLVLEKIKLYIFFDIENEKIIVFQSRMFFDFSAL